MPIPQLAYGGSHGSHGRARVSLAELRGQLAEPSRIDSRQRQRLCELARRLARVQALGGGYARVGFSQQALAAHKKDVATA